ncbi:MAG: hypothetical protein ABR582_17425, partial [Gemmatimonadaceae bacterium]
NVKIRSANRNASVACRAALLGMSAKKARQETDPRRATSLILLVWAWVELNYRPHAYQATEGV